MTKYEQAEARIQKTREAEIRCRNRLKIWQALFWLETRKKIEAMRDMMDAGAAGEII